MCFDISYALKREDIELGFDAKFVDPDAYEPLYHVSAFSLPDVPVITNDKSDSIQMFKWGLIPHWVKDQKTADEIRLKTFNARAESIFEKPSFRGSINTKRCLVITDGFFEWRQVKGKNYPYYIQMSEGGACAMAGIWESWVNKGFKGQIQTFSIVTTKANPLLEMIHNKKKRMPVILRGKEEKTWLEPDLSKEAIMSLLLPISDTYLKAHTVSKLVSNRRTRNTNVKEVIERFNYHELDSEQAKLF